MIIAYATYLPILGCLRTSQHLYCALKLRDERCEQNYKATLPGDRHLLLSHTGRSQRRMGRQGRREAVVSGRHLEETRAEDCQASSLVDMGVGSAKRQTNKQMEPPTVVLEAEELAPAQLCAPWLLLLLLFPLPSVG